MTDSRNLEGVLIHSYGTLTIPDPNSSLGRPIIKNRGQEFVLTAELLAELRDRHGNLPSWVNNLSEPDPDADTEPIAAIGSWPAEKSIFIRGELSWSQERQRRLDAANALSDPAERQKAISKINKELGLTIPMNSNVFAY